MIINQVCASLSGVRYLDNLLYMSRKGPEVGNGMLDFVEVVVGGVNSQNNAEK